MLPNINNVTVPLTPTQYAAINHLITLSGTCTSSFLTAYNQVSEDELLFPSFDDWELISSQLGWC